MTQSTMLRFLRLGMLALACLCALAGPSLAQSTGQVAIKQVARFPQLPAHAMQFALQERTTRYVHGVFGEGFEFATLTAFDGSMLYRPQGKVIEDRLVRIHDLDHNGVPEILLVESNAAQGANLVLIRLNAFDADSGWSVQDVITGPAIGLGHRWMNPLDGQVDVDGDGVDEVAAMTTPHIGGPVVVYRVRGQALEPVVRIPVPGLSNHRYGDPNQDWSRLRQDDQGRTVIELRDRKDWSQIVTVVVPGA